MLVSKKSHGPNVTPNLPNATPYQPNASRWNIGRVGYPGVGACVSHVHLILFVPTQTRFPVEYRLKEYFTL